MPPIHQPPPTGAEEIIAELQQRVIRGITWISAAGAPFLVLLWEYNRWRTGNHSELLRALEVVLLAGVLAQVLAFRRLPPRRNGYFLVAWLTTVSALSLFHNGPMTGNGIAWACTAMLGVFLVGPRAGGAVILTFCMAFSVQLVAIQHGWMSPPRDLAPASGLWALPRIGLSGLIPLVMCILGFALLCRSLTEAVANLIPNASAAKPPAKPSCWRRTR